MIGGWQACSMSAFAILVCALAQSQGLHENKAEEAEVLAADDHYTHGSLHKDLAELDSVWAETFIDTSGGMVRNKREMLETVKNEPKLESIRIDDAKSRSMATRHCHWTVHGYGDRKRQKSLR